LKILVSVKPRSKKSEVLSFESGVLFVKVGAIPHKGASNIELIKTLSEFIGIPKSKIAIVGGFKSKVKTLELDCSSNKLNLALKKLL
jgi:hypothetical protein